MRLASVISSSPRADGLSLRATSTMRRKNRVRSPPNSISAALASLQYKLVDFLHRTRGCLIGLSKIGNNCLVLTTVSGHNLVPAPPARMIPFRELLIACSQAPQSLGLR